MTGFQFERKISMGTVISAVVQIVILVAFISALNFRVGATETAISTVQSWEADTNKTVAAVETRLTTAEVKQQAAADQGAQTASTLKDMQATLSLLLQQTAAINATLKGRGP